MLTLPTIVERKAQPYSAVRAKVAMDQMRPVVDRAYKTIFGWLAQNGIEPAGAALFRYRMIDMPMVELDLAVPVANAVTPGEGMVADALPAGRYGQVTWTGPYDSLRDVHAVLLGWAEQSNGAWDLEETPDGDRFAARFEVYENNPAEVENPDELVTTVAIKVKG